MSGAPRIYGLSQQMVGYAAAVGAAVLMGLLGVFVRRTTSGEAVVAFARFGIGLVFFVMLLAATGNLGAIKIKLSASIIFSGLFLALCVVCYHAAINRTSLANAAFLLYLGPLLATGLGVIFLGERLSLITGALLASAFLGFSLLLEFRFSTQAAGSSGNWYGLLSGAFYALFITANKRIPHEVPVAGRTFYQLLFSAIATLPLAAMSGTRISFMDMGWLSAIGLLHGFLAITLLVGAIKYLRVFEFSLISYLEPVIAAVAGIVFWSEPLSLLQASGAILIILSNLAQLLFVKE
jgi:drug/metabolite transporter (DMT)-like permease